MAAVVGEGVPVKAAHLAGGSAQQVGRVVDLKARLLDRRAAFVNQQIEQAVAGRLNGVGATQQDAFPLCRRQAGPRREGVPGGLDGAVSIRRAGARRPADNLASRWRIAGESFARSGGDFPAVDKQAVSPKHSPDLR